jgi:hypothetical protein
MLQNKPREFRPERMPRRGEVNAWGLAMATAVGLFVLNQTLDIVPGWTWVFFGFLAFSALSISFGNWMDRKTRLQLDTDGISFENGLRHVRLGWSEVQKVAVLPSRLGKVVQVVGQQSHFDFKTLGQVEFQGKLRGQTGLSEGQAILDIILHKTDLVLIEESNNAYYYARA